MDGRGIAVEAWMPESRAGWSSRLRLVFEVFKLRIGLVIGATALAGVALGSGTAPWWKTFVLGLGVVLASSSAGAFNQYYERRTDGRMARTRARPFVTGRLSASAFWPTCIVALAVAGVAGVGVWVNATSAAYVFLGAFFYAVVYTVWLKRRTPLNIVVGGLAGSFAVLAGATVGSADGVGPAALAFALVLFLWTPPHFWSLAIAYEDDYRATGVPMLPVVVGRERAARVVFGSTVALVAASLIPAACGLGPIYLAAAASGGAWFLSTAASLARSPGRRTAMRNFHASLGQLSLLIAAAIVDRAMAL